jgi:hypothetical protein
MHKKKNPSGWRCVLQTLEESHKESSSEERIGLFSYKYLDDILRQCFLHCSLWPEDHFLKEEVVELWMGLGLLDGDDGDTDIQAAYDNGYIYIQKLEDARILEDVEGDHEHRDA